MPEPPPLGRSPTVTSLGGSTKDMDEDALATLDGKPDPLTRQDSVAEEFSKEIDRQRELQLPAGGDAVEGSQSPPPLTARDRGDSDVSDITAEPPKQKKIIKSRVGGGGGGGGAADDDEEETPLKSKTTPKKKGPGRPPKAQKAADDPKQSKLSQSMF